MSLQPLSNCTQPQMKHSFPSNLLTSFRSWMSCPITQLVYMYLTPIPYPSILPLKSIHGYSSSTPRPHYNKIVPKPRSLLTLGLSNGTKYQTLRIHGKLPHTSYYPLDIRHDCVDGTSQMAGLGLFSTPQQTPTQRSRSNARASISVHTRIMSYNIHSTSCSMMNADRVITLHPLQRY